ncbi:MAG: cation transporter [Oscillospiraceae bacterium]|nr:cation transporter [Oscillospiraceae bacterium]
MTREKTIIRTSVIGIGVNVLLAVFKLIVGSISGSIAIVLDAVNNLSDSLSSIVTIIGTKLAGKRPDKTHPFGYGRVEYLTATVISVIILYAGFTSLIESVKKIINPTEPEYTNVTLIIVAVAVIIKFLLGRYFVRVGKEVKASSLVASGKDASLDALVSLTTLIAAAIFILWHVSIEAYLGAIIALLLIRSGFQMLKETLSQILGERPDREKALEVKGLVETFPEVSGVFDLVLHSYGPDSLVGSLHIEVPDTMTADDIDRLEREIAEKVYNESSVILTGISVYAKNTAEGTAAQIRDDIYRRVMAHKYVLQLHGFYCSEEEKLIRFDVVVDFAAPDRGAVFKEAVADVQAAYPEYRIVAIPDADVSDRE